MVTNQIQSDEKCCGMKSVKGRCPKPLENVASYLSKKWTISILITIGNFNELRFNNLLRKLENSTAKILSMRLKELERKGIIKRKIKDSSKLNVAYSLTKNGENLFNALKPLINWSEKQNGII